MNTLLRRFSFSIGLLGLSACSQLITTQPEPTPAPTPSVTVTAASEPETISRSALTREVKLLFAQPYIDPLTRYLAEHKNDKSRASVLPTVLKEREQRCQEIAKRYDSRDKTKANLNRLTRGYNFSCPKVVSNFAQQVEAKTVVQATELKETTAETTVEITETTANTSAPVQTAAASQPDLNTQSVKPAAKANETALTQAVTDCQVLFKIRNYAEAKTTCLPPAEQGNAIAQHNLGEMAALSDDYAQAVNWMQRAAQQGYAPAQYRVGDWAFKDKTHAFSNVQAIDWLKKAAAQDHLAALMLLGQLYYEGRGVTRDYKQALKWFRQAALQHEDAEMQATLGELYYQGQGTSRNYAEASKWFKRAAVQGNVSAQQRLGGLYEQGLGVTASSSEAYIWYSLAASQGDDGSTQARERLAQQLSSAELEQALQRAKTIAAQYQRL